MYRKLIIDSTGATPQQAEAIEEVMRSERPTLDGLTRAQFRRLARQAKAALEADASLRRLYGYPALHCQCCGAAEKIMDLGGVVYSDVSPAFGLCAACINRAIAR